MPLDRKVSFMEGLRYQGGGPMLAWILHRISGLGMILFVSLHVLSSYLTQQFGSDIGISLNIVYQSLYFQLFIFFSILFHSINGMRIIILDTFPKLIMYQRESTWLVWMMFVPMYGMAVFLMIQKAITGG